MNKTINIANDMPCNAGLLREDKTQKPDFTYVGELYEEFARVMKHFQYGEHKYARLNFLKGGNEDDLLSYKKSASRHINQYFNGQRDEDHAAAVIVNMLICMNIEGRMNKVDEI
jgi:hypothetical protein